MTAKDLHASANERSRSLRFTPLQSQAYRSMAFRQHESLMWLTGLGGVLGADRKTLQEVGVSMAVVASLQNLGLVAVSHDKDGEAFYRNALVFPESVLSPLTQSTPEALTEPNRLALIWVLRRCPVPSDPWLQASQGRGVGADERKAAGVTEEALAALVGFGLAQAKTNFDRFDLPVRHRATPLDGPCPSPQISQPSQLQGQAQ